MNFSDQNMNSNYEFTEEQNSQISRLARMMLIVAVLFFVTGGLTILSSISSMSITGFVQGAALLVIGYSLYTASNSFKKIVETTGNDIENLMKAIQQLYTACSMQLYSIAAGLIIAVLVGVL